MSGKMFPQNYTDSIPTKPNESKIPIPSSPTPFRRHNSLRLRGEPGYSDKSPISRTTSREFHSTKGKSNAGHKTTSVDSGQTAASRQAPPPPVIGRQSATGHPLKRGNSFMERGERRDDGATAGRVPIPGSNRPQSVRIAGKTPKVTLNSPQSPGRLRSLSLSLSNTRINSPKSPSIAIASPNHPISPGNTRNLSTSHLDTWDTDSITSIGSSLASATCDHASIARNGTTFSGRSMKYVFHCNQQAGTAGEDYLTPTQRAHRQVKKLKYLLHQAKKDLEQKDSDILKLTKEVVELRLYKAALNSPEDKSQSNSSDAVTVRENTSEQVTPDADVSDSPAHHELNSSIADSGHYEDGTNSSIHSNEDFARSPYKSSTSAETADKAVTAHMGVLDRSSEQSKLIMEYEKRIQELVRTHEEETYHLKQKHNDKVEELLQRITEINSRYWELVPELEAAKEKIKELEHKLEEASKKLEEQEEKAKQTFVQMYSQGQEAARIEHENAVMDIARQHPSRISVPELLNELQVTKNELENIKAMYRQLMEAKSKHKIDPEVTLQFLKSAVYYFLTDKENSKGHLKAIQSILGFTASEIANIDKAIFN